MENLIVPEKFTYQFFQANRYKISEDNGYQAICNNGWIKLYTIPARVYWHAQNQFQHRVPDWKFHISVVHEDVKKAWNLIVGIFLKLKCRAGMKVIYLKQVQKPTPGRQITLYLMKYSEQFKKSSFAEQLGVCISNQHSQDYWIKIIQTINQALKQNNILSNGTAQGQFRITQYISLRNEAFVYDQNSSNYIYPPDQVGFNSLGQQLPIHLTKFKNLNGFIEEDQHFLNKLKPFIVKALIPFTISVLLMIIISKYKKGL